MPRRCAECSKDLNLGHRYCDCGAVLCNECRDGHVAECPRYLTDEDDDVSDLGLYEEDEDDA